MASGITPVSQLPAQVRADGAEGRKLYEAAQGFEAFLLRTLTAGLAESAGGSDESSDAASSAAKEQMPDALVAALQANGGLGLADKIYADLRTRVLG
jgi:Rod binding domain-containing protein